MRRPVPALQQGPKRPLEETPAGVAGEGRGLVYHEQVFVPEQDAVSRVDFRLQVPGRREGYRIGGGQDEGRIPPLAADFEPAFIDESRPCSPVAIPEARLQPIQQCGARLPLFDPGLHDSPHVLIIDFSPVRR